MVYGDGLPSRNWKRHYQKRPNRRQEHQEDAAVRNADVRAERKLPGPAADLPPLQQRRNDQNDCAGGN
jgi:hypothetical protein